MQPVARVVTCYIQRKLRFPKFQKAEGTNGYLRCSLHSKVYTLYAAPRPRLPQYHTHHTHFKVHLGSSHLLAPPVNNPSPGPPPFSSPLSPLALPLCSPLHTSLLPVLVMLPPQPGPGCRLCSVSFLCSIHLGCLWLISLVSTIKPFPLATPLSSYIVSLYIA